MILILWGIAHSMKLPFRRKKKTWLSPREEEQVVRAITRAEEGHRGEVQVFIEGRFQGDGPLERAAELFAQLGLNQTRDGTGVLLYIAGEDRRVAVWAGPGVHQAREPGFWQQVVDEVAHGFARGERAAGIEAGLMQVRELLLEAAPGEDTAGNELEDRVIQQ